MESKTWPGVPVEFTKEEADRFFYAFNLIRMVNVTRAPRFGKTIEERPLEYWALAMIGEAGEACNEVKKILRDGNDTSRLAAEIADVVIYCDLLAAKAGIDLADAISEKFNRVSDIMQSPIKLPARGL